MGFGKGATSTAKTRIGPAKITPPRSDGIMPRARLFRLLDEHRPVPVTWISSPAGSGKTSLISSYIHVRRVPYLWYRVDAGDADIATFFYYMGLAAKKAAPRFRKPLPLLTPAYLLGVPVFTRRYFEELFRRLRPPFVVVLDNYQEAPAESSFHEVLNAGLSLVPEGIRVFVLSRNRPPPTFMRLLANNAMHLVEWNDLRFTLEETKQIIRARARRQLTEDALAAFHQRTQGWVAGLVLLMQGVGTTTGRVQSAENAASENVFDYFAEEVFDSLEPGVREFLLKTSFLPKMTEQTAKKLTGRENAGRILSDLNRDNFFTDKHQASAPVYQYHPLFQEFLLSQASERLDPADIVRVQNRAAALLEESGQFEDAAPVYRDARNWERLGSLILSQAQSLILQGRWKTLQDWIGSLPESVVESNPWLLYWMGFSYLPISPAGSRNHFEKAFELFRANGDAAGSFLSLSGMIDSVSYHFGSAAEFDRLIPLMYDLRKEFKDFGSPAIEARVVETMVYAICARKPQHPDMPYWIERGLSLAENIDDIDRQAYLFGIIGFFLTAFGELEKASLIIDSFRRAATTSRVTPIAKVMWKDLEAFHSWLSSDFDRNRKATDEGMAVADNTGVHIADAFILGHGVAGALSIGEMKRSDGLLKRMRACIDAHPVVWSESLYYALSAWKALLERDLGRASRHADLAVKFGEESGYALTEALHHLIKALVMHEVKQDEEALACIAESRRICRTIEVHQAEFGCLLAEARFAFDRGEESRGTSLLGRALKIGRERRFFNAFFWMPSEMAKLCVKALEAGLEVEYVRELVRRRSLVPESPPIWCEHWPWALQVFTLGRFEILINGRSIAFFKKTPKKPLEMLKVLIALGGQSVAETRLCDILWPDADGDAAHKALGVTLTRLRGLLDLKEAVQLKEGRVTLDRRLIWTDVWALEQFGAQLTNGKGGVEQLYRGPFLPGEKGSWVISFRERIRRKFLYLIMQAGKHLEANSEFLRAIDGYLKGLEVDDLIEEFYVRIMICYQRLGRRAEAVSVYKQCRSTLGSHGIATSPETEAIYRNLVS